MTAIKPLCVGILRTQFTFASTTVFHLVPLLLQESSHLVPLLLQESSLQRLVFLLKLFSFTLVLFTDGPMHWISLLHTIYRVHAECHRASFTPFVHGHPVDGVLVEKLPVV